MLNIKGQRSRVKGQWLGLWLRLELGLELVLGLEITDKR